MSARPQRQGRTAGTATGQSSQIDRRSPVPFFFQLKRSISEQLEAGRWAPGDRIPSEAELCEQFGVSRTTVRQALAELEREGRLRKEKGRGTFVAEPRASTWFLQSSHGFHDEASEAGREVTSRLLQRELTALPTWAAGALELPEGTEAIRLERLRSVDGEVVMYVDSYLLAEFADLVMEAELERGSLYATLRDGAGVDVAGGRRVVEAAMAEQDLARLLGVKAGSALLLVEAVSWDQNQRHFECYRAWHRSDRTKIVVQVLGEQVAETAGLKTATLQLET